MNRLAGSVGLAAALAGCGGPTDGTDGRFGLEFVSGRTAADTIEAVLGQSVVVTIRDAPSRTVVVFEGGTPIERGAFVRVARDVAGAPFSMAVSDTTDDLGRASARVQLGDVIGQATLRVVVPALGLLDSASFQIGRGRPAFMFIEPRDTALLVGGSYQPRIRSIDRVGNAVSDQVAVTSLDPNVSVANATVTATAVGRARLLAQSVPAGRFDSAFVSVVPDGAISGFDQQGWVLSRTDGAVIQRRPTPLGGAGFTPDWSPAGTELVIDQSSGPLRIIDLSGAVTTLSGPPLAIEIYPEFSASGQWIYYTYSDGPGFSIHRMRPNGTGDTTIIAVSGHDVAPSPSPDETRLAYTIAGPDELRVYDLGSRRSSPLAPVGHTPAWSPDGARIAFVVEGALGVVNPNGTGLRTLTANLRFELGIDWSPDSKWLVAKGDVFNLVDAATGLVLPLAFTRGWIAPSWKPR